MARYILIDEDAKTILDDNLDFEDFVKVNGLEDWEVEDMIKRFEEGRPSYHGGGAAPVFSVLRVEDYP